MSGDPRTAEQIQMLEATVEQIRQSRFPDVPAELVQRILAHHADAAASEAELTRQADQLVDQHLAEREA